MDMFSPYLLCGVWIHSPLDDRLYAARASVWLHVTGGELWRALYELCCSSIASMNSGWSIRGNTRWDISMSVPSGGATKAVSLAEADDIVVVAVVGLNEVVVAATDEEESKAALDVNRALL